MTSPPVPAPPAAAPPIPLIDSSLYAFRAWRAVPSSRDARGRAVNAVRGFAAFLAPVLGDARGAHALCAFDEHRGGGRRRAIWPGYKAGRPPVDADLLDQIPRCRDVAAALGAPVLSSPEVEADDIVGQMAALARAAGHPVRIVSGDKDLAQHVRDGDALHDVGRARPLDRTGVRKRFGVEPWQIPDLLALAGDDSDGIPGVPGVGPPTAARLLKRFADLDALFANASQVASMRFRGAPRVATLLVEHEARVRLSRRLTGLLEEPALPRSLDALERREIDPDEAARRLVEAGVEAAAAPGLVARAHASR